ncbi:MAG: DUF4364 family protein [Clostridiales bacterium]|nr:DUF4364 family protein [Clostridiales bacterium]
MPDTQCAGFGDNEYERIEGKLLLLYLIDQMDIPLSNNQISQFALNEDYMDYFILQQNLTEMTESGFLDKYQDNNTTRYTILDKGIEILDFFQKRIPTDIRNKINQYVLENRKTIKKDYEVTANYFYDHTNNEFIVKCGVYEDETMLMELNISVVSKEQAKTICANWKKNVKTLYGDTLASLLAKPSKPQTEEV